jgi:predicted metal-dependent hydrolase
VSRKSEKIAALIAECPDDGLSRHYSGYFACFNRQWFFEAHDVLEELWLAQGKTGANYSYYKGLIQLAGAFVHLQKDRLRPSVALFDLADANLRKYPAIHDGLDLNEVLKLIADWRIRILKSEFSKNPLPVSEPPQLLEPTYPILMQTNPG